MMRAMAIVRMKSKASTSSLSASGVPLTFTNMLIGTLSGGVGRLASCSSSPARSFTLSQSDDAAGADFDPSITHFVQRIRALGRYGW